MAAAVSVDDGYSASEEEAEAEVLEEVPASSGAPPGYLSVLREYPSRPRNEWQAPDGSCHSSKPPRGGTSVARPGWPRAMLLLRSRRRRMGRRRRLLLRPAASGWLCHGVGLASVLSTRPRLPSVCVRYTVVSRSPRPRSFRSMSGRRLCARHRGRGWPELALHGDYVAAIFGAGCGPPSLHCAVFSLPSARFDLG